MVYPGDVITLTQAMNCEIHMGLWPPEIVVVDDDEASPTIDLDVKN